MRTRNGSRRSTHNSWCGLLVGLVLSTAPVAGASESPAEIEIADGRQGWTESDVSAWRDAPAVRAAIEGARAFWSNQESAHPEDVDVQATAEGSFTRAGAEQRLVLYRMSLYPRSFPRKGLALLEGDALVRNFAFTGLAHDLGTVPDLDGDGRDEVLLFGSFGMGGQQSWGAGLARFSDAGLEDLGHVTLFDSACGMDPERYGGPSAWRLYSKAGRLQVQPYRKATCDADAWDPAGDPESFESDSEKRYDEIPVATSAAREEAPFEFVDVEDLPMPDGFEDAGAFQARVDSSIPARTLQLRTWRRTIEAPVPSLLGDPSEASS